MQVAEKMVALDGVFQVTALVFESRETQKPDISVVPGPYPT
jgi:hypothetical protein